MEVDQRPVRVGLAATDEGRPADGPEPGQPRPALAVHPVDQGAAVTVARDVDVGGVHQQLCLPGKLIELHLMAIVPPAD